MRREFTESVIDEVSQRAAVFTRAADGSLVMQAVALLSREVTPGAVTVDVRAGGGWHSLSRSRVRNFGADCRGLGVGATVTEQEGMNTTLKDPNTREHAEHDPQRSVAPQTQPKVACAECFSPSLSSSFSNVFNMP